MSIFDTSKYFWMITLLSKLFLETHYLIAGASSTIHYSISFDWKIKEFDDNNEGVFSFQILIDSESQMLTGVNNVEDGVIIRKNLSPTKGKITSKIRRLIKIES